MEIRTAPRLKLFNSHLHIRDLKVITYIRINEVIDTTAIGIVNSNMVTNTNISAISQHNNLMVVVTGLSQSVRL